MWFNRDAPPTSTMRLDKSETHGALVQGSNTNT